MIFRSPWLPLQHASASVADAVLGAAGQLGEKPALIDGETGRTLTYRQLIHGAERVAAGLARAGLEPGQPLALALPNSIDFALAFFGAIRAGAWVVPINPIYTPDEMEHQIHDAGARFLITVPERAADLAAAVDGIFEIGGRWNELLECGGTPPEVRSSPDGLAMLPYSSGTTGKPKGVMLTHANVLAGEIPMAFVVRKDGAYLDAAELMNFVAARVAPHKKIRAVEFIAEIPKSPTGKILRRVLKERVRTRGAAG